MNGRSFVSAVAKPYLSDKTNQQALADAQSKIKQAINYFVKTSAGKSIASAGGSTGSEYEEVILTPLNYVPFKDLGVVGYMMNPAVDPAKQQEIRNLFAKVGIKEVPIPNSSRPGKNNGVGESLVKEFSNGHSRDDDSGEDPYKYPKPEHYGRSIDFFGQFEADHFDHEEMNDATGVFKGYWDNDQIAYFKFDNPAKTGSDDPGMGWYYEPQSDIGSDDISDKPAVDTSAQRKQQELSMISAFLKSGQTPKPGSQIHALMKKHGIAEGSEQQYAVTIDAIDHGVLAPVTVVASSEEEAKQKAIAGVKASMIKRGYELMVRSVSAKPESGVAEGHVMEDEGGASPGATTSADIAVVAYPMTRGRNRREKRRNARRAVGQTMDNAPSYIGQGVFESSLATMRDYFAGNTDAKDPTKLAVMRDYFTKIDKDIPEPIQRIVWKVKNNVSLNPHEFNQYKEWMNNRRQEKIAKEAHVLDHKNVIYRLDRNKPMTDTEVLVLGGAGRYTLGGLRDKARREADAMAADLKVEHGGSFRRAAENIKQLTNTLNTIVAAYNELKRIRSRGGRGSRGITDEESNFMRECTQRMNTLELYTQRVKQAQRIVEGIHRYLKEDKMNPEQASIIKGMFHLNTDPGYGFYRYAIHVAGNHGGDKVVLGPNAGPFAYAYTDEEDKMIRDAVKAITGKEPVELTGGKSKEPDFVNKNSTVPSIDWKKVK